VEATVQLDHQGEVGIEDIRELAAHCPLTQPDWQAVAALDVAQVAELEQRMHSSRDISQDRSQRASMA
jgi:hypothetical protein